jgi:hypothetical protein
MIHLDNVTLLGIDCVDIERLIYAADVSQKGIKFKDVKLLTHLDVDDERIVNIPEINTIEAYSEFMIKRLYDFVDTDFVLIIQYDGFVLNPEKWQSKFLEFDYIGAPTKSGTGNGGFSLRSKKLLELMAKTEHINEFHPEDTAICKTYRSFLESKGIRFADLNTARDFSIENNIWSHQFGFHNADISKWDIDSCTDAKKHSKYITKFKEKYVESPIRLTYVVPIYLEDISSQKLNPLYELINIYSRYDEKILKQIHFVFVDDHSKPKITIPEDTPLNYTLVRITDDIMWNQGGARNLGVKFAKSDHIIVTDLDVLFPDTLLESLISFHPPANSIFKFNTYLGLKKVQPHFNVFFMSREVFYKTNGIDEEFSGHYGHEDTFFYFLQKALGTRFYVYKPSNIVHKEHKYSKELQHNKLVRKSEVNQLLMDKKHELLNTLKNPLDARSDMYLNFSWEVLQEHKIDSIEVS